MRLHEDSFDISPALVRELLAAQAPRRWATLPLRPAGNGTDNVMMRLGDDLVVRLPQRHESSAAIVKEGAWLPRLRISLPLQVPRPVFIAPPSTGYPSPWAVYEWIEGEEPRDDTVADWAAFGRDLAGFVGSLHAVDVRHEGPDESLRWYRGQPCQTSVTRRPPSSTRSPRWSSTNESTSTSPGCARCGGP